MATKKSGITAGKLAMGLGLLACVAVLLCALELLRGTSGAAVTLSVIMAMLGSLSVCEVLTTPVRTVSSYAYRLPLSGVVVVGSIGVVWLWLHAPAMFYLAFIGVVATDGLAQLGGRKLVALHDRLPPNHKSGLLCKASVHPHQLADISAGKTLGGFACGLGGGAVTMMCLLAVVGHFWPEMGLSYGFCVFVPLCATAGDLFASKVKRAMNADDFLLVGKPLLRSHGGVTDRGDSHWLVFGIVFLLMWASGL